MVQHNEQRIKLKNLISTHASKNIKQFVFLIDLLRTFFFTFKFSMPHMFLTMPTMEGDSAHIACFHLTSRRQCLLVKNTSISLLWELKSIFMYILRENIPLY